MSVSGSKSLQIKVNNKELKEVDHFKYLGSVLTLDGYCTKEFKMRIVIAKEAFNRKMSLLKSKLNIELREKLGVMFGALLYMAQRLGHYKNWTRSNVRALKCDAGGE